MQEHIESDLLSKLTQSPITKTLLPDPEFLEKYEKILPGSADRILSIIEKQIQHRQDLQNKKLRKHHIETRLGQILGFIIGIFAISAGSYTALQGAEIPGGFIGTAGVVGLVAVFVIGSNKKKQLNSV